MGFVVTLTDFTPLERTDEVPWTHALIEEAAAPDGAWSQIQDVTLDPVDTDPAHPRTRTLTTASAALEHGWYRVIWRDDTAGQTPPTAPVENVDSGLTGLRPTVGEVAKMLPRRTKEVGSAGREVGTFTTKTRPTSDDVEGLISDAIDEVLGKVTVPVPGSMLERRARGAIRLYTAMLVELTYFAEQTGDASRSPFSSYEKLYDSRMEALVAESETGEPQGMGGAAGDAPADASWYFPDDAGGLVGWQSRW